MKIIYLFYTFSAFLIISCNSREKAAEYYKAGYEELSKKNFVGAIDNLTKSIKKEETNPLAYNYRGLAYFMTRDYNNALLDFNTAIRLNPRSGDFYMNRGGLFNALENYDAAVMDYTKAIEIEPKPDLYYLRGEARSYLNQKDSAIKDLEYALEWQPALETEIKPILDNLKK